MKCILQFYEENVLKMAICEGEILLKKNYTKVIVGENYFRQLHALGIR